MIRILHSVSNMDRAGIETMLMNYYRYIDREKVQFDFLCNKSKPGAYDMEISELGGRIFHTPGLNPVKYFKYLNYMKQLFVDYPEYKIIEAHNGAMGVYTLYFCKKNNIDCRIYHAHGANLDRDWKYPIKLFWKNQLASNAKYNYSCGLAAAEFYFGKKNMLNGNYELIPNAIEVEKFVFSRKNRNKIRTEFSFENKKIIGHVGRFSLEKNHKFMISTFKKIHKECEDSIMIFLGDGPLLGQIKNMVEKEGLQDKIFFMGNIANVNEWYSAFDILILPSVREGLPVVGVEAQAADLPCVFSDTVTKEIGFSQKSQFISTDDPEKWVESICKVLKNPLERIDNTELITDKGYNIKNEAVKLQNRYIKLYEESVK